MRKAVSRATSTMFPSSNQNSSSCLRVSGGSVEGGSSGSVRWRFVGRASSILLSRMDVKWWGTRTELDNVAAQRV